MELHEWKEYNGFWVSERLCKPYDACHWLREESKNYGAEWDFKLIIGNYQGSPVWGAAMTNKEMAAMFRLTFDHAIISGNNIK